MRPLRSSNLNLRVFHFLDEGVDESVGIEKVQAEEVDEALFGRQGIPFAVKVLRIIVSALYLMYNDIRGIVRIGNPKTLIVVGRPLVVSVTCSSP